MKRKKDLRYEGKAKKKESVGGCLRVVRKESRDSFRRFLRRKQRKEPKKKKKQKKKGRKMLSLYREK